MGGDACVMASWPSAGAAVPRVKPPANVAPLFRSSRRLKRFEPIGLSFADEPQKENRLPEAESIRSSRRPIEQVRSALGPPLSGELRSFRRASYQDNCAVWLCVVTLNFASWNQLEGWLRQVDRVRRAARSLSPPSGHTTSGVMGFAGRVRHIPSLL